MTAAKILRAVKVSFAEDLYVTIKVCLMDLPLVARWYITPPGIKLINNLKWLMV